MIRRCCFVLLAAIGAMNFGAIALAGDAPTGVEYSVQTSVEDLIEERFEFKPVGPIDLSVTAKGIATAACVADVGFGVNKARAVLLSFDANNPMSGGVVLSAARWSDVVTISDAKLNGTQGSFNSTLRITGAGDLTMSSSWAESFDVFLLARWLATVEVSPLEGIGDEKNIIFYEGDWVQDPFSGKRLEYSGDPLNSAQQEGTFTFTYGEPFVLSGYLETFILLDNQELIPGTIDATIDLSNSAYWNGISAIRDSSGQLVNGANLSSESGTDWRNPVNVPEPAFWTLLIVTLAIAQRRAARPNSAREPSTRFAVESGARPA